PRATTSRSRRSHESPISRPSADPVGGASAPLEKAGARVGHVDTPSVPIVTTPLEVADGLRMLSLRTPTLPPATHTNAYLVGTRELVLIEPASPYDDDIER